MMTIQKRGPTPAQAMSQRTWTNARLIEDIIRLKNSMVGLSPETREAFQRFKDGVWDDIKFQKRQREMYQQENKEGAQAVVRANLKNYQKARNEKKKAFDKKIQDALKATYTCYACKDTGEADRAQGLVAWCKCPIGIEKMFGPNWKQSDDKMAWICTECKMLWSNRKVHYCVVNYQIRRKA